MLSERSELDCEPKYSAALACTVDELECIGANSCLILRISVVTEQLGSKAAPRRP